MHSSIVPGAWVVLKFPSGHQRLVEVQPKTTIHIGKFGSFPADAIIDKPYYLTFEILDRADGDAKTKLRTIPPAELLVEQLELHTPTAAEARDASGTNTPRAQQETLTAEGGVEYDIVADDGTVLIKSNRLTIDDPSRQKLSYDEIEALKKAEKGGGKEIIAAILKNHAALDEKTSFSLHKYTVRKKQKYLRRFTVLPVDVARLCALLHDSNPQRTLEIREETLGLLMSWANLRSCGGRWLVVDDTGGLLVAAMAERIDVLYGDAIGEDQPSKEEETLDIEMADAPSKADDDSAAAQDAESKPKPTRRRGPDTYQAAQTNSITLLHPAAQPNLSLLKHFGFPQENQRASHPLYSHLKTLSWLSLLSPESDPSLVEPEDPTPEVWETWKSGKQSSHRKKRRRWERMLKLVAETRQGDFDGLVVASGGMELAGIFRRLVPLVKGGGQVVCYGATMEPMAELIDLYSRERRAAFTMLENERVAADLAAQAAATEEEKQLDDVAAPLHDDVEAHVGNGSHDNPSDPAQVLSEKNISAQYPFPSDHATDREDFPVNPLLLLAPTLQTVRAQHWQVLPGRTHPQMMEKGGAEGYVFAATRVIPAEGRIEARGRFQKNKKRKADDVDDEANKRVAAEENTEAPQEA